LVTNGLSVFFYMRRRIVPSRRLQCSRTSRDRDEFQPETWLRRNASQAHCLASRSDLITQQSGH